MDEKPTSTVAGYLAQVNRVLSTQGGRVKGEVTSVSFSGKAVYFTIKDKDEPALLNCLIWASTYQANGVELKEGNEIIVTGTPDIYAPFGKFSFKSTTIEYAGEGALKRAYDKLKATLAAEGLFAPENKRPLPDFPKKIGVITSMSGVVINDFTSNLNRRGYKITTIDSRVDGKDAIHDLLASLKTMNHQDIDVLVIMRGGGSWESLQPFNTESVVRAIADFKAPVITGIGHDTDVTLAEMVADIGRSTPTAVAEALNEPWDGLESTIDLLHRRTLGEFGNVLLDKKNQVAENSSTALHKFERGLSAAQTKMSRSSIRISSAFGKISRRMRDVNSSLQKAMGIMRVRLNSQRSYLQSIPKTINQKFKFQLTSTSQSLDESFRQSVRRQADAIRESSKLLTAHQRTITLNDPRRTMRLGYSLSYANGKLARNVSDVSTGSLVTTQLSDGEFTSIVKEVNT